MRDAERAADALRAIELSHPKDIHELVRRLETQERRAVDPRMVIGRAGGYVPSGTGPGGRPTTEEEDAAECDSPEVIRMKLQGTG